MSKLRLEIDTDRLMSELETISGFSDTPAPAVTRILFTSADQEARNYLKGLFAAANLVVRQDAAGNLFARWLGTKRELSVVGTGSHCDAIPHSGRYDGTVGVLGGLEAIRALQRAGFRPTRSIELIMFTAEEPTRFGVGCLGSRLLSGQMSAVDAAKLNDADDMTFEQARTAAGCDGELSSVKLANGHFASFVELHIEQGPRLERGGIPIGVVTEIAAPATLRVTYEGQGGHAGAVLMPDRHDALIPAAQLVTSVERTALEMGGPDTVATTGVLNVHPGAVNSIPSRTSLEIDIRDTQCQRRDAVIREIQRLARRFADQRRINTTIDVINADPPASCDRGIISMISTACDNAGLASQEMISRAYHDSLFMALICPTSMIFIPCRDGLSHHPDEYAAPEDITAGVEVLARTLAMLAADE